MLLVLFLLNTSTFFKSLMMMTYAIGLIKFLGKIRSPAVVYNVEEQYYFSRRLMGATNLVHTKIEISDSNPASNPSSQNVRVVKFEEVGVCTVFLGGVPVNKIFGLMKVDHVFFKHYKTHYGQVNVDVESFF